MKIAVVGTGYVRFVTGTCFAEASNAVTCVYIDKDKITQMQTGQVPIYEPGLKDLFKRNIKENRRHKRYAGIFMAPPTPPGSDGPADLSYSIGAAIKAVI